MEVMHELIPFAREMMSQKPNRKMVKMYLLGSVLAFLGVVIGLVETVVSPFTSSEREEEEEERVVPNTELVPRPPQQTVEVVLEKKSPSKPEIGVRSPATRGHAS